MSARKNKLDSVASVFVAVFLALTLGGCIGAPGGARSAVFAGTVSGPVGAAVTYAKVVRMYEASAEQKASALKIARRATAQNRQGKARYVSVSVKRTKQQKASGNASSSATPVVVYDTETDKLASEKVFELEEKPEKDAYIEFDTYFSRHLE